LRSVVAGTAPAPVAVFPPFAREVCFVGASADGSSIFASSWDSTGRVITSGGESFTLAHDQFAIWAVAAGPDCFFTAGGDSSIRKFSANGALLIDKPQAHARSVRALAWVPAIERLISVANDGFLIEWDSDLNEVSRTFVSADGLLSLAVLDPAARRYALGGNGGGIFVVESGSLTDFFPIGKDVWDLTVLANGDLVGGADDGFVYALTHSLERRAFDLLESSFFSRLASPVFKFPGAEGAALETLPELSGAPPALQSTPTLFRQGDAKVLAVFVPGYGEWFKVATVTAPPRQRDLQGQSWDLVVDVIVGDTAARQLCFNRGENEYVVANRFLISEGLGMQHFEPIANFLRVSASEFVADAAYSSLRPEFGEAPALEVDPAEAVAALRRAFSEGTIDRSTAIRRAIVRREDARDLLPVAQIAPYVQAVVAARALDLLADHFVAYGDTMAEELAAVDPIGRIGPVATAEEAAFSRFVLNFACFSIRKPAVLEYVAGRWEAAFAAVTTAEAKGRLLRAADVAGTYSRSALARIKPFVERFAAGPEAASQDSRVLAHINGLSLQ
jgi:hypothetical protein